MEQSPLSSTEQFIDRFVALRDKNALKLGQTIHALSRYPIFHLCHPWCSCRELKNTRRQLRAKIVRQQAIITNLQDGVLQPAIEYLNELAGKHHQTSTVDSLLLRLLGPRVTRLSEQQRLAQLAKKSAVTLTQTREAKFRRLLSND